MGPVLPSFQLRLGGYKQLGAPAPARDPAKEKQAAWSAHCLGSETMAECLLYQSGPAHSASRPAIETANPEHGLLTREPDALADPRRYGAGLGATHLDG